MLSSSSGSSGSLDVKQQQRRATSPARGGTSEFASARIPDIAEDGEDRDVATEAGGGRGAGTPVSVSGSEDEQGE